MKRASRPRATTILKPGSFATWFIFALALTVIAMLASVTAFMQEPTGDETQSKETRIEPATIKTPLGPGVALSYPELDLPAEQTDAPAKTPVAAAESAPHNNAIERAAAPRAPRAAITCNGAGGNWSAAGSWTGGVPTAADTATITSGCTIIIDTAAVALDVTVQSGGILQFDNATGTLTVGQSVTVDSGGIFQTDPAGTVTTHTLSVGTNLTNNGTLDFSTTATAGADLTFTGAGNNSFSGTGATTDIRTLTINKGTSNLNTLELLTSNFTVQGASAAVSNFVTLTNGTLKVSGTFTFNSIVFTPAAYSIGATAGFWLNNPNFTVNGQAGSPTNSGLLRISNGTFNVGTGSGNSMGAGVGAAFTIEGGILNVTGRLNSANAVTYTQSGGAVNVSTVGNASSSTPSFGFTSTLPTNFMNMSGGAINLVQASTAVTPLDYNQQGTINLTGGTLNVGTAATLTNFVFRAQGNMPNVVIDNTTNNKTLNSSGTGYVYGNFTIQAGTTFNPNAFILNMLGSTFTNNGTITGCIATSATSRLQFSGAVAQSYTGTGSVCSAANPLFGFSVINRGAGVTIDPAANPFFAARLLLFSGSLINTNKVDLNQSGANVMVIQRGGVAQLPAGSADVAPSFTGGTSFLILVYSQSAGAVTTGVEIPASRTIRSLQEFNTNGVTLAGGPLTSIGAAGAAPDSVGLFLGGTTAAVAGGPLNTSAANLLTISATNTGALLGGSENAYVNGPLARNLPASLVSGSTYLFPIGKSTYKAFELVNPTTNAGGTVTVQAEMFDADSGGTAGAGLDAINTNRYWNAQFTSGAANFTNSSVRVTELNSTNNALGQSATQAGAYASVGGTLLPATVQSAATTSLGFFALGRVATTPTFTGGTFTIGTGGTYPTLTAAMADLSGKLITGPITYSLLATYSSAGETFPIVVPRNGGSSATNTITIKPDVGVTTSITGSSTSAIIRINDSFVTIDGSNISGGSTRDLTIQNTNVTANTAAIWVASSGTSAGATNVTLKNLNVRAGLGGATTNIFGIFAGGTAVGTNGDNNAFLKIQNNAIDTAFEGITARVATVLNGINNNLVIQNNVIGNANAANLVIFRGISVLGAAAPLIRQNEIFNMQTTTVTSHISGIELGSTVYYATVTRNLIHDIVNNESVGSGAFGIEISSSTNDFSNTFTNNAISNCYGRGFSTTSLTFDPVGIRLLGGPGNKVYFNSVNMFGAMVTASWSAAFSADAATNSGLDLRDNIFGNAMTGPGASKAYGAFVTTATAFGTSANLGFGTINYNDYYSTGTASVANFINFFGVDHTSLTAWRASTQNDVNSISADPLFISPTNLDLQGGSPAIAAGQTIAGITFDILGRARGNPPSIGAYEPGGGPTAAPGFISGRVTTTQGGPLAGVTINLSGSSDGQAVTDANGFYRFDNLTSSGFYSITPARDGFSFSPSSRSFSLLSNMTEATFTAIAAAAPAMISGQVTTTSGAPMPGVTMLLSGARSARTITDANGIYRFANVSTDNFYNVTPSILNYHFTPAVRSFSLLGNRTDATFTGTLNEVISGNVIDTPEYFVRQHYLDFLGREPDESGLNFWSDQIQSCGNDFRCVERRTINVSAAYFLSIEFRETGGLVDGLYQASYGRAPRFNEFMPDTARIAHDLIVGETGWQELLRTNKQEFLDAWVERAAFRAAYDNLSDDSYVEALIRNTGVTFSDGERGALVSGLSGGTLTRAGVLQQVAENERFVSAKFNERFVRMQYFGYLRRDPDDSGFHFWLNKLNEFHGNFEQAEMVRAFIVSGEYRDRFRQ